MARDAERMGRRKGAPFTPFMKHYDLLRSFLRRISYGCYARADFIALGVSGRSYDDLRRRMEVFVPEMYVRKSRHKNVQNVTLRGDAYLSSNNYLIHSFRCAGFTSPIQVFCLLSILQYVQTLDRSVPRVELLNRLALGMPDLNESTLRSYLRLLCEVGLLRRTSMGTAQFTAVKNPLRTLSAEDARLLRFAMVFYRQAALVAVLGYDPADVLDRSFPPAPTETLWLFKNAPAVRILDDAVLLTLISAIERREAVSFCYEGSALCRTMMPYTLSVRTSDQRRYVTGAEGGTQLSLRIDKMSDVRVVRASIRRQKERAGGDEKCEADTEIALRLCFDSAAMRRALSARIRVQFPLAVFVREKSHSCTVHFAARDPRSLAPFLRTMYPYCAVIAPESLRSYMLKDVREALRRYE